MDSGKPSAGKKQQVGLLAKVLLAGHSEVETPAGVKFSTYGLPVIRPNKQSAQTRSRRTRTGNASFRFRCFE